MNLAQLKIQLVKKVLETEDIETLLMLDKLLQTYRASEGNFPTSSELIPLAKTLTPEKDMLDIQKDIEDVFGD